MTAGEIVHLAQSGKDAAALRALENWQPLSGERVEAASLALRLGRPSLAAGWWREMLEDGKDVSRARLGLAAALLRLGRGEEMLDVLRDEPVSARVAVLRARATGSMEGAREARNIAREEGDAPALIAAATLLGQYLLAEGDVKAALRTLAEGLKVSEIVGEAADAYLLAVLAAAQAQVGSPQKARRTAQKALERSDPRSPARVLALLALEREEEARAEARAGELGAETSGWWRL